MAAVLRYTFATSGQRPAGCGQKKRVMNLRWVQGLAEDLPAVAPGPYRLVSFGQSFHWTDEQAVAEAVYDMLEPGGAMALIVHTVTGRPRPPDPLRSPIRAQALASGRYVVMP
jgi:hypothetical protein